MTKKMNIKERFTAMTKELADAALDDAKEILLKDGHLVGPNHIIAMDLDNDIVLDMPFGWESVDERSRVLKMIRVMLMIKKVVSYVIISEAWAKQEKGEKAKEIADKHRWGSLAKDPQRVEVVNVLAVTPLYKAARSDKILRERMNDESSKVIGFEELDKFEGDGYLDGDLINLFHPAVVEIFKKHQEAGV